MSVEDNHACRSNLDNCISSFEGASQQRRSSDSNADDFSESPLPPPDLAEDDDDDDDDFPSAMTASYSEICFDQDDDDADLLPGEMVDLAEVQDATQGLTELVEQLNRDEGLQEQRRPHTLSLKDNTKAEPTRHKGQQTSDSQATSPGSSLLSADDVLDSQGLQKRRGSGASGLSELQGTVTYDGEMVNFVAEDLHEKIKLSSPVAKKSEVGSFPGSRSSTPSLYRQALQPSPFGLVDPGVLADLESQARAVAASVDTLLESLGSSLHGISSLTIDCVKLYESSMCKTCDSVDANIKSMYQLMVKYEELSKSMRPLYSIANEVKNIKKLLDHFENVVEGKT
ncbi:BLOC-1-related complex subunit 6-like [Ornithodoros turicata]|uniref:BLOC-1-related complex subunit 6-like n=1 Tax=Ornithodoros turicata TaxID=34597 RepID=UPI003138A6AA